MERYMRHPVHIRSCDVDGWDDLADAWNTGVLIVGDDGRPNVQFDRIPAGKQAEVVGAYNNWSPSISASKRAAQAAKQGEA